MNKITVLGLVKERSKLLKSLMELGVVDINQEEPGEDLKDKVHNPNVNAELNRIDSVISELSRALEILNVYEPVKKPMFSARKIISEEDYTAIMKNSDQIIGLASQINRNEDEIIRMKGEENRLRGLISSLSPWMDLDIPLDIPETRSALFITGSLPSGIDLGAAEASPYEACPETHLLRGISDRDHHYVAILAHKSVESEAMTILRSMGFNRINLRDVEGTAKESKAKFERKLADLEKDREAKIAAIRELAGERERIEVVSDGYRMERTRIEAKSLMISTRSVFVLKGWLPAELSQKVKDFLDSNYYCSVEILEPAEDEPFPVLIENGPVVESIKPVIDMYGVPSSGEIDPSPYVMPFFVFFFGLMLGDGGYGIIIALISGFILKKYRLEDSTRRFMKLIFFCGLSSIFAGLLFGSWFGIASLTKTALWIVPSQNPELMLSWSMLFGIIHMYVGIFLRGLNLLRRKKYLDALFDAFFFYIFFTGFILTLLPFAPGIDTSNLGWLVKIGNILFAVGTGLIILTQGRKSKSIFGKIFGGFGKLYDVVSFFGDTLSYTRLVALGLASAIIGDIVNTMSTSFGGNIIVTIIGGGLIIVLGHTINIGLNVLGSYVHSCRLQYLEFFGKFLEGGGEAFKPLSAKTKYIIVKTETSKVLNSGVKTGVA